MSLLSRNIFLAVLMFLAYSCKGPKEIEETANENAQSTLAKPNWLSQRPINSSFYTGIGSSSKVNEPLDYMQVAKKNALNDLSSEIRVIVEAESFLNTIDRNYQFEEEFQSTISTKVLEDIEDFEVVDSYETATDYWVYYRLSKADHARIKKEKKDRALSAAFDYYTKGKEAIAQNNFAIGFDLQLRALLEMKEYWPEVNSFPTENGPIYLDNEIYSSLRTLGSELKLEIASNPILLESKNNFQNDVRVVATRNGAPVKGLNINFQYDKGKYSPPSSLITNEDGSITIPVKDVNTKSSSLYLALWIDLKEQISPDLDQKLSTPLVSGIKTEELNVQIKLVYPRLFFASDEKVFGESSASHRLRDAFSSKLSSEGFSSTTRLTDGDYEILILSNTAEGGTSQGFHVAFLDMTISIKSKISQDEIFKRSFTKIKGLQLNFESASSEAYKKGIKLIEDEVSIEFIEQLF